MKYLLVFLMGVLFVGCGDGEVADLTVDEFIVANNLETRELDDGVHIVIDKPGNDTKPNINSSIVVNYAGELTNGDQFDANSNLELQMSGIIKGWQIGLKEIGEGGSCTLIIPPGAGYGGDARPGIPANSVLVFELDLIEVK